MKKIVVLGGTGFLGRHLVKRLIDREYNVRMLVRDSSDMSYLSNLEKVEIIRGDYFDEKQLKHVVAHSDAVMTTIAPKPFGTLSDVDMSRYKASFVELLRLIEVHKIERFMHIAGSTIRFKGENLSLRRRLLRLVLTTISGPSVRLKDFELQTMQQSDVNWISIRSPRIQDGINGSFLADAHKMPGGKVDVIHLANFMIDQLEQEDWVKKAPFVATT
ncbi:MAG: NAD(P)H-binding protein [Chloroflexota bacterium]